MKFGRVDNIEEIDFSLPETIVLGKKVKEGGSKKLNFFLGAPAWGDKSFIGRIYPKGARPSDFLYHYSRHFNCIELNTTFYRIPKSEVLENWLKATPADFRFCPKLPQSLSNGNPLGKSENSTEAFYRLVDVLSPKLGSVFIQLSLHFSMEREQELFKFLDALPQDLDIGVEFRHKSWFEDRQYFLQVCEHLSQSNRSVVITDTAGRRDVLHLNIMEPNVFIRFTGNGLHSSDYERADDWLEKVLQLQNSGVKNIYFMIHQPDESLCVDIAQHIGKKLSVVEDIVMRYPQPYSSDQQISLF